MNKRELAKLRKDAERYRFLRSTSRPITMMQQDYWPEAKPMRLVTGWSSLWVGGYQDGRKPQRFDSAVDELMRGIDSRAQAKS